MGFVTGSATGVCTATLTAPVVGVLRGRTSSENSPEDFWGMLIEGGYTAQDVLRLLLSVAVGKTSVVDLGGGAATVKFRDTGDTKDRVTATMDGSERGSVTLDAS